MESTIPLIDVVSSRNKISSNTEKRVASTSQLQGDRTSCLLTHPQSGRAWDLMLKLYDFDFAGRFDVAKMVVHHTIITSMDQ